MGEAFITRRGGIGKPKEPTSWTFLQMLNANGSFLMEGGKWYRVLCFGAGGAGGAGGWGSDKSGGSSGGGGGGSGGLAISQLLVPQNVTVPITINNTITSFGSYLSASAGDPGGAGIYAVYHFAGKHPVDAVGKGGASGTGYGGNLQNYSGAPGGNGGISAQEGSSGVQAVGSPGIQGGNSGMLGGGVQPTSSGSMTVVSHGGGGGGGQAPISTYTGAAKNYIAGVGGSYISTTYGFKLPIIAQPYPDTAHQRIFTYGGGGGAGGMSIEGGVPAGGLGSPGIIVIEKGVG